MASLGGGIIKALSKKICTAAVLLLLAAVALVALVGCQGDTGERTGVKVVFNLEGATYRNMSEPVVYYYKFAPGTENLIKDPFALTGNEYTKTNYNFKGWYRTRTEENGTVTYSDKWDFATDKVTDDGVTLYACWRQYILEAGMLDDDGNFVSFGEPKYVMDDKPSSWTFDKDEFAYEHDKVYAEDGGVYSFTGVFKDVDGNVLDGDITHPRGDTDETVKIVAEYIEGDYTVVGTASELKSAVSNSANIFLKNDIDFGGGTFGGFSAFSGEFNGNGKTVKNFSLSYDRGATVTDSNLLDGTGLICLSIFGRAKNAVVKDVRFENVSVDIDLDYSRINYVYLAPLFVTMENCKMNNVAFTGTFTCTRLPDGFTPDRLHVVTDRMYYVADGDNESIGVETPVVTDRTAEYFA